MDRNPSFALLLFTFSIRLETAQELGLDHYLVFVCLDQCYAQSGLNEHFVSGEGSSDPRITLGHQLTFVAEVDLLDGTLYNSNYSVKCYLKEHFELICLEFQC